MDRLDEPEELRQYRLAYRRWLAEHVPDGWRDKLAGAGSDELVAWQRSWLKELHTGGYAVPHWPAAYGGSDASLEQQIILHEENARARAPTPWLFVGALYHGGVTLITYGTDEQKRCYLPRILEGEIWCQGFSEPGAGSDLASLQTRAVRRGDRYVINGQKVWSSMAEFADLCILLARTDPDAPKRKGISFFLMDMNTPGVEVRPIRQITGQTEFCEIFLTDVEIPAENLVGEENDGWRVTQLTLSTERGLLLIDRIEGLRAAMSSLTDLVRRRSLSDDPEIRRGVARYHADVEVLSAMCSRLLRELARKGGTGAEASILKVTYSELLQRLTDFGVGLGGLPAHTDAAVPHIFESGAGHWLVDHVGSWAWTIAAGSNEIQRTLIGERLLGLPREPSLA